MINNKGHILKTAVLGNTKVIIYDDYVAKTPEEKIAILTDLKQLIYELYTSK